MESDARSSAHHHEAPRVHSVLHRRHVGERALSRRCVVLAGVLVLLGAVTGCTSSAPAGGGGTGPGTGTGTGEDFFGVWDVNTKLTAGSDPVNPSYKEGDLRIDVWTIAGTLDKASLTGNQGTVHGRIDGTNATFEIQVDTGLGIIAKGRFDLFLTSSASLKGTIKADYYSAQFGYKVGLDAWTAEGVKRA